ncbi:MAG: glycosyltransferase family 39 protein [Abitibacteriaceae bacterium]|nr:glycosyltransferase family 39 protein [Abditibacteriaceae bacterium]
MRTLYSRRKATLTWLLLVAFLIRFSAVLALRDIHAGPGDEMGADGIEFNMLALQVAHGLGYTWGHSPTISPHSVGHPTAFRAPGFPLFLAIIYAIAGENYVLAYLSFCLLGTLSCLLTYLLARELFSARQALLSTTLAVVYLPGVYNATVFASENLFIPCMALGLWFFIRYLKKPSSKLLILCGLTLGWGTLTRPFTLLLLPILLGLLTLHQRRQQTKIMPHSAAHPALKIGAPARSSKGSVLAAGILFTVSFLMVVLPWTARNYAVYHKLALVATNGGSTFYGANNTRVLKELPHLGSWISTTELPGRSAIVATPDEVAHDKMEWKLGFAWVRQNLASMPLLCFYKFLRLWLPDVESGNKKYVFLQVVGYTPFLLLYIVGFIHCWRHRRYCTMPWWAVHSTLLATVLMALIFWGSPRFRDANMPILLLYATIGWEALRARRRSA